MKTRRELLREAAALGLLVGSWPALAEDLPLAVHRPDDEDGLWIYDSGGDIAEELYGEGDPEMLAAVMEVVESNPIFARIHAEEKLSLVLCDITDPKNLGYAMINPDWETFTASLSKIAVMLGVVSTAREQNKPELLVEYQEALDQMIKWSSNEHARWLFDRVGHDAISGAVNAHGLYDPERGGLWWTRSSEASKKEGLKVCGTARQVARYFLKMEQGRLVSPEDSRFIKSVLRGASLAIFSQGIKSGFKGLTHYGKPGIYGASVCEGLLIEGPNTRYVMSVLTEGLDYQDPVIGTFGQGLHRIVLDRQG